MSDEKIILTPEEALACLKVVDGEVHCMLNPMLNPASGVFIGADWKLSSVELLCRQAVLIEVGGEHSMKMGHAVVAWWTQTEPNFFAHDPEKLSALIEAKSKPAPPEKPPVDYKAFAERAMAQLRAVIPTCDFQEASFGPCCGKFALIKIHGCEGEVSHACCSDHIASESWKVDGDGCDHESLKHLADSHALLAEWEAATK